MRVIIVDDDPIFVELLQGFLKTENVEVVAKFDNPLKVSAYIKNNTVDLIYLDLHMPIMEGSEFLEVFKDSLPPVILTTSDSSFGIAAFEYNVIGYLVKPFSYADFKKSFDKASVLSNNREKTESNIIFIKSAGVIHRLDKSDILYIECVGDYAAIYTSSQKHILHGSMRQMERNFPSPDFIRVHRSFIVRFNKINQIEDDSIILNDKQIPLGKTYKQEVLSKLKTI